MDIKDIVLIMLVIIVLYLIYKTRNLEKLSIDVPTIEHFDTSINTAINNKYSTNIQDLRDLSEAADKIYSDINTTTLPADNIYVNNIVINGSIKTTNKNQLLINILPKYSILAWAHANIPLGWAICNGKRFLLDDTGKAIENTVGILTPDLRGRFILGVGTGKDEKNKDMTERKLNEIGGEEKHELTKEEMPSHGHNLHIYGDPNGSDSTSGKTTLMLTDRQFHWFQSELNTNRKDNNTNRLPVEIKKTGGVLQPNTGKISEGADKDYPDPAEYKTTPHNNMPPFYVLTYIMKL